MDASFSSIVVPNVITAQLGVLLDLLITHNFTPLVCGPTGTGKSVFINTVLNEHLDQNIYKPIQIAFTAKTSANQTQDQVDHNNRRIAAGDRLARRRVGVGGVAAVVHADHAAAGVLPRRRAGYALAALAVPLSVLARPRHVRVGHAAGGVNAVSNVAVRPARVGVLGLQVAFVVHAAGCELPLVCEHASLSLSFAKQTQAQATYRRSIRIPRCRSSALGTRAG